MDCAGNPIVGGTVSIAGDVGTIKYANDDGVPLAMDNFTSTQGLGVAYIFNVPPGEYEIDAMYGSDSLREHNVKSYADASTTTVIIP
jgi:hypothetical protein